MEAKLKLFKIYTDKYEFTIRILNYHVLSIYIFIRQWWFRLFGIGISAKDIRFHDLLFSERNGYRKYLRIGNWVFHYLKYHACKKRTK